MSGGLPAPVVAAALGVVALIGTAVAAVAAPGASPGPFAASAPLVIPTSAPSAASVVVATGPTATAAPSPSAEPAITVVVQPTPSAAPVSHPVQEPILPGTHAAGSWVDATASATGIPARALQAYGDATLTLQAEDPACHLGWTILAGIGWIESGHGTHGGATLGDDGRPSIPIVGPALDGSPGRAAIHSTAQSAAWHGDPVWDHAVGPMQFIPSTWARWGADGDGDGDENPQDIDDAALAAARYLCAGGRDLATADGWWGAVLSYNHDDSYATSVYAKANAYAAAARG